MRARRPTLRGRTHNGSQVPPSGLNPNSRISAGDPLPNSLTRSRPSNPRPLLPRQSPGAKGGQAVIGAGLRLEHKLGDFPWCFYALGCVPNRLQGGSEGNGEERETQRHRGHREEGRGGGGEVVIAMVGRGDQSNCRILQVDVRARRPTLREDLTAASGWENS